MLFFVDYLWIWIVLTLATAGVCWTWFLNDQQGKTFAAAVVLPLLILGSGLGLYYGVDTDRKSIRRMLDALVRSVEKGDYAAVEKFLTDEAENTRRDAKHNMDFIEVFNARYVNLEVAVNDAASPPIAEVRFTAAFEWQNKKPIEGFSLDRPVPERVQFEIELVKTKDNSWLINNCRYFLRK
ncbi:MAG: hypothetical protein LBH00_03995 [Planctomycetaceae bacterium]|jgi:hypothetical protein|nr:hypothetical protein [Planctomycetaceae bacterium]